MDVENILKVAGAIEQHSIPDLGFNMRAFRCEADGHVVDLSGRNCGTVACIAGWAEALREIEGQFDMGTAEYFGVPDDERIHNLMMPPGWLDAPEQYTEAAAVRLLRHFAETGEVDWPRALEA